MCHLSLFNFQNNEIRYYHYLCFTTVKKKKTQKVGNLPGVPRWHVAKTGLKSVVLSPKSMLLTTSLYFHSLSQYFSTTICISKRNIKY